MSRQIHQRRGITLLFVISLIVLFLLMGAAFVTISGNFMRTSRGRLSLEVRGDSASTLIDRALMDLLRGSTNPKSALNHPIFGDQSLLGDEYATGFKGEILSAASEANGQLIRITLKVPLIEPPTDLLLLDKVGAFGGQCITFISNPTSDGTTPKPTALVKGTSCRIFHYDVQYDPTTGIPTSRSFLVVPETTNGLNPFANALDLGDDPVDMNDTGAIVLINGRAFAGTGTDPTETYDAIDPANAFLAGVDFASGNPPVIYPSFSHFPTNPIYNAFRAFPSAAPVIDNDGDGQLDSIWIDPGFAVQTDSAGRQYKPLVAYMVLDLDGRFNLNLHGSGDDARGRIVGNVPLLGNPAIVPQGQGFGPTEISLGRLFPPPGGFPATPGNFNQEYYNILGDPANQYYGRFGDDGPGGTYGPGESEVRDVWSQYKLFGYPTGGIGNLFGSRMDVFGKYGWGFSNYVLTTAQGDLPYGMPQVDATPLADDLIDNSFETDMAGYPSAGSSFNPLIDPVTPSIQHDHLFSLKELERVYRMFDMDSKFLPNRLLTLAPTTLGDPSNRLRVATDSWEVPVPPSNSAAELATIVQSLAPTRMAEVANMLSPDILQGLKMDINRPFGNGFDDGVGAIDGYFDLTDGSGDLNPVTYPDGSNLELDISRNGQGNVDNLVFARANFAKQLYVLARIWLRGAGDFDGDGLDIDADNIVPKDRDILAQWCINVVDFRDPDAIMAPFEFDLNPFNGWQCDGNPATVDWDPGPDSEWGIAGIDDDGFNGIDDIGEAGWPASDDVRSYTVWGCERPELLITETFAAHDRRTENADTSDANFESRLIPVASAFIELYAPCVAGNDVAYPAELYQGSDVDLGRTHNGLANGDPVWRIAIIRDNLPMNEHYDPYEPPYDPINPLDARDKDPDVGMLDSSEAYRYLYFIKPPDSYFANTDTAGVFAETFFPAAGFNLLLPVGQHAVIGSSGNLRSDLTPPVVPPGYVSTFGRRTFAMEGVPASFDFNHTRSITLDPAAGEVRIEDFDPGTGAMMLTPLTRNNVVAVPVDQVMTDVVRAPRSFNVSDPLGGYLIDPADPLDLITKAPTLPLLIADTLTPPEDGLEYETLRDIPIDYERRTTASDLSDYHAIRDDRTTPTFRVVHLQRLANPLAPWNSVINPYRTVDSASINLTSFNGVSPVADVDPYTPGFDPSGPSTDIDDIHRDFAAMERGRSEKYVTAKDTPPPASVDDHRLLWPQERRLFRNPNVSIPGIPPVLIGAYDDISEANLAVPDLVPGVDQHFFSSMMYQSLGMFNEAYFDVGLDASKPFTWLTWNNRPYVSQFELMLVPTKSSSQLLTSPQLLKYNSWLLNGYTARGSDDPYNITAANSTGSGFAHLPNFFLQQSGVPPVMVNLELYKLLDFVEVPSRYVGTERYFNSNPATAMPIFGLAPPFNNISRFRYPGKVNINTILDPELWNGVMGEYSTVVPTGGPFLDYNVMNASRRDAMNEFANPFRETIDPAIGVNGGLLRKGSFTDALFGYDPGTWNSQQGHNNSDRNAYFRYDPLQRMGNLVTTRSSVFAIWITVGYFEVDPSTGNLLPGALELGSDNGQIKRHRGFFIFDRSIPVGFEQGVDHNTERAIMVQSYIE